MAIETEQQETHDDGIEIVLDNRDADIDVVVDRPGEAGGSVAVDRRGEPDGSVIVDYIAAVEPDPDPASPAVEVVVVDDAYVTADHADAQQVFAAAARLRPLFAVLSIVMMICVALAVYGVSVLVTA